MEPLPLPLPEPLPPPLLVALDFEAVDVWVEDEDSLTAAFPAAICFSGLGLAVALAVEAVALAVEAVVVSAESSQLLPLESGWMVVVGSAALAEANAAAEGVHSAGRLALRVSVAYNQTCQWAWDGMSVYSGVPGEGGNTGRKIWCRVSCRSQGLYTLHDMNHNAKRVAHQYDIGQVTGGLTSRYFSS